MPVPHRLCFPVASRSPLANTDVYLPLCAQVIEKKKGHREEQNQSELEIQRDVDRDGFYKAQNRSDLNQLCTRR